MAGGTTKAKRLHLAEPKFVNLWGEHVKVLGHISQRYAKSIPVKITGSRSRNLFVGTIQNSHLKWFTKTKSDQELNLYKNQNRPRFSPYKKNHIFLSNPPWFPFVTSLVRLVGKSKPFRSGKNPLNSICAKKTLLQIVLRLLKSSRIPFLANIFFMVSIWFWIRFAGMFFLWRGKWFMIFSWFQYGFEYGRENDLWFF